MYNFQREIGKKRDVLFIHGYASTRSSFNKLKKYERTFNIISINLPFDKIIDNHELSIETYIKYVNQFVKEEHLKDFDVVGHSLGSAIALGIKDAKRIILIAPFNPFINNKESWLLPKNKNDSQEAVKNTIYKYQDHWNDNVVDFMTKKHLNFIAKNHRFLAPLVQKQILNNQYYKEGLTNLFKTRNFVIIGGKNDQYVSIESMRKTTKRFHGKIFEIEACGHSPIFEKPQKVLKIIETILGEKN